MSGKIRTERAFFNRNGHQVVTYACTCNSRPAPYYLRFRPSTANAQSVLCSDCENSVPAHASPITERENYPGKRIYHLRSRIVNAVLSHNKTSSVPQFSENCTSATAACVLLENSTPLHQLPDELLVKIFSYSNEEDICRLSQVCKRFHAICNDVVLWKRLYQKVFMYNKPLMKFSGRFQFVDPKGGKWHNPWKESFVQLYQGVHVRSRSEERHCLGSNNRRRRKMKFYRKLASALNHSCGIGKNGKKFIFIHAAKTNLMNIETLFDNVILLLDEDSHWPNRRVGRTLVTSVKRNIFFYYFNLYSAENDAVWDQWLRWWFGLNHVL